MAWFCHLLLLCRVFEACVGCVCVRARPRGCAGGMVRGGFRTWVCCMLGSARSLGDTVPSSFSFKLFLAMFVSRCSSYSEGADILSGCEGVGWSGVWLWLCHFVRHGLCRADE